MNRRNVRDKTWREVIVRDIKLLTLCGLCFLGAWVIEQTWPDWYRLWYFWAGTMYAGRVRRSK